MSENMYSPDDVPEWLSVVPMDLPPQLQVPIGEGDKTISASHLLGALNIEVDTSIGSFSIAPELAQLIAESTENSAWRNLPTEPTVVTRTAEDSWGVRVGEVTVELGKEGIVDAIAKAVAADAEAQANKEIKR